MLAEVRRGNCRFQALPIQRACNVSGTGIYWDAPSAPFMVGMSFMHMSPSPDEPGAVQNHDFGPFASQEPSVTVPYADINGNPLPAWQSMSVDDMLCAVDHHARFTVGLQVSGITAVPFQNNMVVAPTGAVTIYNPLTFTVSVVSGYTVSGTSVLLPDTYPPGTGYMVEYTASPLYVAFRRAGALPHNRMFGGGIDNLPTRFRLQTLDYWTRQRVGGAVPNVFPPNPRA